MEQLTQSYTLTSNAFLRSLRNEANRQSEYFERRNLPELSHYWHLIEQAAHQALNNRTSIRLIVSEQVQTPPIIKASE